MSLENHYSGPIEDIPKRAWSADTYRWHTEYPGVSNAIANNNENDAATADIQAPSYYVGDRKFEPADVMDDWDLHRWLAIALKYISRAGRKTYDGLTPEQSEVRDLGKAVWYLNRRIITLESECINARNAE